MHKTPVIAVFDIGKTNKKFFLFDAGYHVVHESTHQFEEVTDEDGFPCEDLILLQSFIVHTLSSIVKKKQFDIKAVNFAGYGASMIHLDETGHTLTPLYNYLKPYPESLKFQLYSMYGGEQKISVETASPVLGSLNAGMQLYRIKKEHPEVYAKIRNSLHLPQYLSYLITKKCVSDITSIGCHTQLWDFKRNNYHDWVAKEGLQHTLAPLVDSTSHFPVTMHNHSFVAGIGLHDSSAALIPYLIQMEEPFLLLSTGTWSISLNPFNHTSLTAEELKNDCLCYLSFKGAPVKAARLFAGYEHEQQTARIASHFNQQADRYSSMHFDTTIIEKLKVNRIALHRPSEKQIEFAAYSPFQYRDLNSFHSFEEAYHQLIMDLVQQQSISSQWVLKDTRVNRIFVDGGFSKNRVYMTLLASVFAGKEVFAASMSHATAQGAALAIHTCWNDQPYHSKIIELNYYERAF